MSSQSKAASAWEQLNARQQQYMELIYRADQAAEHSEDRRWLEGKSARPAAIWRWLFYGDVALNYGSPLKRALQAANLVDQGTGSTFDALERRKLIECSGIVPELHVKLTRFGRQAARLGLKEEREQRPRTPKGHLSALGWQALSLACIADDTGVPEESGYRYGGIHENAWKRLRKYKNPPLIEVLDEAVYVTLFGHLFYIDHYPQYCSIYPAVNAPPPPRTKSDIERVIQAAEQEPQSRFRQKRGDRTYREIAAEIDSPDVGAATLSRFEHYKYISPDRLALILAWLNQ